MRSNIQGAEELRNVVRGKVMCDVPMAQYTTWRVGGPADILLIPYDAEDVFSACQLAQRYGLVVTVIGNGSNILVKDTGIRGLVIRTAGGLTGITPVGQSSLRVNAGTMVGSLIGHCVRHSLEGLEFLAGIPATVGGATIMNAGAMGRCMGEILQTVEVLDSNMVVKQYHRQDLSFAYRHSSLMKMQNIVLAATLEVRPGNGSRITERARQNLSLRRKQQPLDSPSAGSVFINPPGWAAGYLIEKAGGKGLTQGGAKVSSKHANFIVNTGSATASDILGLIDKVRALVQKQFDILLETEIRILG